MSKYPRGRQILFPGRADPCHLIPTCLTNPPFPINPREKLLSLPPAFAVLHLLRAVSPPVLLPLTLAPNPEALKPLPGSPGSFCRKCQQGEMRTQKGQERIPSPPKPCFPLKEEEGQDLQANCEPRTSPKLILRTTSPPHIGSLHRKRRSLKHSKFTRKQKKKPEYVLKSWQPKKPEDPHPSCPRPQETRTSGSSQALGAERGAEL